MNAVRMSSRAAFSLLEVIIATAILASSAMVLFSLIGLGAKFGSRAEQRTLAMMQAQSLLDEYMANWPASDTSTEKTGVLPGVPSRSFLIQSQAVDFPGMQDTGSGQSRSGAPHSLLYRITVSLFDETASLEDRNAKPLIQVSQWIRSVQNSHQDAGPGGASKPVKQPNERRNSTRRRNQE